MTTKKKLLKLYAKCLTKSKNREYKASLIRSYRLYYQGKTGEAYVHLPLRPISIELEEIQDILISLPP